MSWQNIDTIPIISLTTHLILKRMWIYKPTPIMLSTIIIGCPMHIMQYSSCVLVSERLTIEIKESGQLCSHVYYLLWYYIKVSYGFSGFNLWSVAGVWISLRQAFLSQHGKACTVKITWSQTLVVFKTNLYNHIFQGALIHGKEPLCFSIYLP